MNILENAYSLIAKLENGARDAVYSGDYEKADRLQERADEISEAYEAIRDGQATAQAWATIKAAAQEREFLRYNR
jgi:hypothetical protein